MSTTQIPNPAECLRIIKAHQLAAPVQVVAIARALGLRVFRSSFTGNTDLSGMIRKEDDGYSIYVNRLHSDGRRRFTIAHEIAHFILHRDQIGDGIVDDALYRSGLSSAMEAEANRLAADILMPWHLMAEETIDEDAVQRLAEKYSVSRAVMAIRLNAPAAAAG